MTHFDWAASSALVWEFTPNHFLRGAVSRAFRRPTMFEEFVYGPTAGDIHGNDSLSNETLVSYEIGYRGQLDKNLSVNVEGYLNKDKNMIARKYDDFTSWFLRYRNAYDVTTYGIETSMEWKPVDWWLIRGFHNYMHQTGRNELTNWRTGTTEVILPPKHRMGLTNRFNLDKSTTLNTQLYWTDVSTQYLEYIHGQPFWRLDIRLARRFWNDQAEIAVGANNLLDRRHYEGGYDWGTNKYNEVPQMFYVQFFYKF
jgi:outer membrane receptor protein involved in Fe transport